MRRVARLNKICQRVAEPPSKFNVHLAKWDRQDYVAIYAAKEVIAQHYWAEGFLN